MSGNDLVSSESCVGEPIDDVTVANEKMNPTGPKKLLDNPNEVKWQRKNKPENVSDSRPTGEAGYSN